MLSTARTRTAQHEIILLHTIATPTSAGQRKPPHTRAERRAAARIAIITAKAVIRRDAVCACADTAGPPSLMHNQGVLARTAEYVHRLFEQARQVVLTRLVKHFLSFLIWANEADAIWSRMFKRSDCSGYFYTGGAKTAATNACHGARASTLLLPDANARLSIAGSSIGWHIANRPAEIFITFIYLPICYGTNLDQEMQPSSYDPAYFRKRAEVLIY